MNPTYDFKGQVALVTGASSGMGLAAARAFAEAGAAVVLANLKEEAVKAAAQELAAAGRKAVAVWCDVSDGAQVAAMRVPRRRHGRARPAGRGGPCARLRRANARAGADPAVRARLADRGGGALVQGVRRRAWARGAGL